jgi:hypothetical protein
MNADTIMTCPEPEAKLRDRGKIPTGQHRCWASINNKDDQPDEVSRALFKSQLER